MSIGIERTLSQDEAWFADAHNMNENIYRKIYPTFYTCSLCLENVRFEKTITCCQGSHHFCVPCLKHFWNYGMNNLNSWKIDSESKLPLCPIKGTGCGLLMTETSLKASKIINKYMWESFLDGMSTRALSEMVTNEKGKIEWIQCNDKKNCNALILVDNKKI